MTFYMLLYFYEEIICVIVENIKVFHTQKWEMVCEMGSQLELSIRNLIIAEQLKTNVTAIKGTMNRSLSLIHSKL